MNRKVLTYLSFCLLCGVGLLAQNWRPTDNKWTDKNFPFFASSPKSNDGLWMEPRRHPDLLADVSV